MTQTIKAVTTTCWQHVRMPPGPRCASAVGKWREWWRGSLGPCRRQHMPQPVRSITLPLIVPACEAETISHCYSLWWGHKSNNKRKKKKTKIAVKSLATELDFFRRVVFSCVLRIQKGKGIVDACPFPCLNTGVHIFIHCPWFNESDRLGAGFCFRRQSPGLCRIDGGRWDHKEQASDERTDNKSGSYSHPFCGDTKNPKKQWRMSPIGASDWSIQLHVAQSHRWISQMRHSYCRSLGLSIPLVLSRRVSSNYRPRSPRSWGFFHPIKFYYWDWQWPSRGHRVRHPVPI